MNGDNEESINRDYIGIVIEEGGSLITKQVEIPRDKNLIKELEVMAKNDKKNLIDLQNVFLQELPKSEFQEMFFDFIYPYPYNSAYVGGADYPKLMTYPEYKDELDKYEGGKREELLDSEEAKNELASIKEKSENDYSIEIQNREKMIIEKVEERKSLLKDIFVRNCDRFITGLSYSKVLDDIRRKFGSELKMFSSEKVGWSRFYFPLNEDIDIDLKTNFGYGTAAYFFCNIIYKGINLLPYSAVVRYYYVNWLEITRYTRKYSVERQSWNHVFDFVTSIGNLAKNNPYEFVHKWIINEVEEMVRGLKAFILNPAKEYKRYYINKARGKSYSGLYMLVQNRGYEEDRHAYRILPQETIMALKAEKITGSLHFLDSLKKLKVIYPQIQHYIEEILSMNKRIKPEIIEHLIGIDGDLEKLNRIHNTQIMNIKLYEVKLRPFETEIKEEEEKQSSSKNFSHITFIEEYKKRNKEYTHLLDQLNKVRKDKNETEMNIKLRQSFKEKLQNNLKTIKKLAIAI